MNYPDPRDDDQRAGTGAALFIGLASALLLMALLVGLLIGIGKLI